MIPGQDEIRQRLKSLCQAWGFVATEELPGGHCSIVLANAKQVLKFPFQGEEQASGWRLAVAMSGIIGPAVEKVDEASGALLMERIWPGTPMNDVSISDEEGLDIILSFGAKISQLEVVGLLPLKEFVDQASPWYVQVVDRPNKVTLHGDLHHQNILLGPNGWVVIDPKGLIGDPAFEPSAYLRNPLELLEKATDIEALLDRRLAWITSKTGWPELDVLAWAALALGDGPHLPGWERLARQFDSRRTMWHH